MGLDEYFYETEVAMIINCIGAGVASLAGYLYVIKYDKNPLRNVIERGYIGNKFLSKHVKKQEDAEEKDKNI